MTEPTDAEHIPHTCGGFSGAFYGQHKRMPSAQEIWDAAIRSYRDLNRAPPAVAGEPDYATFALWCADHIGDENKPVRDAALATYEAFATPQPTQAQPVAVPLTAEPLPSYDPLGIGIRSEEEAAAFKKWLEKDRAASAHGIKGGQHGAEH